MATIDIIIPLYNKGKYVKRAIDSVVGQSFSDWHLIVVDDGSTDNGPEIVNSINDSRILLIQQSNQGPGAARNNGIKLTQADYIAFLDADDEWYPNHLENAYNAITSNDVAMVVAMYKISPGMICWKDIFLKYQLDFGIYEILNKYSPQQVQMIFATLKTVNSLIKREIIPKYGNFYDLDGCRFAEDLTLLIKIALNERFMFIDSNAFIYHTDASELDPYHGKSFARPLHPFLKDPQIKIKILVGKSY